MSGGTQLRVAVAIAMSVLLVVVAFVISDEDSPRPSDTVMVNEQTRPSEECLERHSQMAMPGRAEWRLDHLRQSLRDCQTADAWADAALRQSLGSTTGRVTFLRTVEYFTGEPVEVGQSAAMTREQALTILRAICDQPAAKTSSVCMSIRREVEAKTRGQGPFVS
jgi:hypothetical protein